MSVRLSLIVCMARNRVIGRAGGMPWRMPTDLKHFKATTLGKPVIMGRKTFASIGRALPGRINFVVSREPNLALAGATVAASLDTAIAAAAATGGDEIMILGGGEIYALALPLADRIYVTELHAAVDGDTRFPPLDPRAWRALSRTPLATGPKDDYAADVVVFERVR